MDDMEKLDGLSMDIEQAERDKLRAVFPQCFVEGKLDIDKLLNLCGEYITDDFEKYEFKWNGKSECVQIAGKRSAGTLRPCPEESVDWENTRNIYIEGDNLEVLKLLQTSYFRKVKMIYIDPPYNTGNDFVYEDDFADPLERYREITRQTTKSNPESMGRFHTNWLNMMWPRLRLATNLLCDDGIIFISIDDGEVYNLRKLCDEVFGEEHFVAQITLLNNPKGRSQDKYVATCHEFLLVYSKTTLPKGAVSIGKSNEQINDEYPLSDENGSYRELELRNTHRDFGKYNRPNLYYPFFVSPTGQVALTPSADSVEVFPDWEDGFQGCWTWGQEKSSNELPLLVAKQIKGSWKIYRKAYAVIDGKSVVKQVKSIWTEKQFQTEKGQTALNELFATKEKLFQSPKSVEMIAECIRMSNLGDSDIILDFFSGSATTAHAVMQLNADDGGNYRFILVQLPEVCDENSEAAKAGYANICEIGKERIRRAGTKIKEENPIGTAELDTGFRVFKLDSSNLKLWDDSPISGEDAVAEFEARLRGMLDILKPDRFDVDVVYEVMLKLGQDLYEPITAIDIGGGRQVYGVGNARAEQARRGYEGANGSTAPECDVPADRLECRADVKFIVCLAQNIGVEEAAIMAEYAPGRIIFADQCFVNSEAKSNVKLTLRDKGITIRAL